MKRVVGMIPARFGSKRFPGKPLALIAGTSLIRRAYENAASVLDEVYVLTDNKNIFDHVKGFGEVLMSSPNCPTGTDRCAEANRVVGADIVVNLQGDWPCLEEHVIEAVIDGLGDGESMASAVVKLEDPELIRSASMVKCVMDCNGYALYFSRSPIPWGSQHAFGHLGIYGYTKEFLNIYANLPDTPAQQAESLEQLKPLEHGFKIRMAVVDSVPLSVDRPEDIERVECAISS